MQGLIVYVTLCMGGSKGNVEIQIWCIPEKRVVSWVNDPFDLY